MKLSPGRAIIWTAINTKIEIADAALSAWFVVRSALSAWFVVRKA